ncbi:MAG: type II toxin-antitoxin system HicA family toxin [bacterium]|nr:type II toxin-antitoxin system HicA family toxin [bacterium]
MVRLLRKAGFKGPFEGAKHQFLQRGSRTGRIPNPHRSDIAKGLLRQILREAELSVREWEKL